MTNTNQIINGENELGAQVEVMWPYLLHTSQLKAQINTVHYLNHYY